MAPHCAFRNSEAKPTDKAPQSSVRASVGRGRLPEPLSPRLQTRDQDPHVLYRESNETKSGEQPVCTESTIPVLSLVNKGAERWPCGFSTSPNRNTQKESSLVVQWVKDLILSLQWLQSLRGVDLIPGQGTSTCHGCSQKKKNPPKNKK